MAELKLTYAGLSYLDKTISLESGEVRPEGIDLVFVKFSRPGELFKRQRELAEFDVSEMSLSNFTMMTARGDDRFVGIPVFPSRHFRHKDVYVHTGSGIDGPKGLSGRDVGVLQYQMTAAVWVRGILEHDHGVDHRDIRWWSGGLTAPAVPGEHEAEVDLVRPTLPPGVKLGLIPGDRTLEGMLEDGSLSALVTSRPPKAFVAGSPSVRRLFRDYRDVERDFFRRTGLFPIMHVVVVRRALYERHPWVARSLLKAFAEAKMRGHERMRALGTLAVSLPWLAEHLEELDDLFGGDAFPYGLKLNRKVLETTISYQLEQGLVSRTVEVEELFATETQSSLTD